MKNSKKLAPKVSIVIPVYNGSNYLKEAIDSALAQTYKNIEVIIVNDGSNDNGATEKIARSDGDRICYYKKENGGVATALNLGIKKMTGEYFSWLSHDDLYARQKIELQLRRLMKEKVKNTIIACNAKALFDSGVKKRTKIDKHAFEYMDIFLSTSAVVGLNGCSLLLPRDAFKEVGVFDDSLHYTQDYDLWFRVQKKFRFVLLDRYLVISRTHPEQASVRNNERMIEAGDELHSKFMNTIPHSRFEEYFRAHKQNIKHSYENYKVYKARRYKKTATIMLKTILRFYSENNRDEFYRIFYEELVSNVTNKLVSYGQLQIHHNRIDEEYRVLIDSGDNLLPIKYPPTPHAVKLSKVRRLTDSLRQDGIYLSGEKAVRRLHSRLLRNNKP